MKESENGTKDSSDGIKETSNIQSVSQSSKIPDGGWGWVIVVVSFMYWFTGRSLTFLSLYWFIIIIVFCA